jgi:hypothetical protein
MPAVSPRVPMGQTVMLTRLDDRPEKEYKKTLKDEQLELSGRHSTSVDAENVKQSMLMGYVAGNPHLENHYYSNSKFYVSIYHKVNSNEY